MVNYPAMPRAAATVVELRPRDADRTQEVILRAAMAEFSERGLGGARVDRIAERAGINKKLIYYYFGSKDKLFLAVLEATYTDIREAEKVLKLEALAPVDAVRSLVAFTWQYFLDHPEFLNLLNSENLRNSSTC
jgi:AcrR family transcriptional regulator